MKNEKTNSIAYSIQDFFYDRNCIKMCYPLDDEKSNLII